MAREAAGTRETPNVREAAVSVSAAGKTRSTGGSSPSLDPLQQRLGYKFTHLELLEKALTHSSMAYERGLEKGVHDADDTNGERDRGNEQLEFLGDAVLGMVTAEWLYRMPGSGNEGQLTRMRAALVRRNSLAHAAERLHLGDSLRLGHGEENSGGRHKAALLADALEAVIAAVYLDGGLQAAAQLVEREVIAPAQERLHGGHSGDWEDWKSALQEWLQARGPERAQYVMVNESGPDHKKEFTLELRVGEEVLAQATAESKKQAEQECARDGLAKLRGKEE
jgi:ribonuclease III